MGLKKPTSDPPKPTVPHLCWACEGYGLDPHTVRMVACETCDGLGLTFKEPWISELGWAEHHARSVPPKLWEEYEKVVQESEALRGRLAGMRSRWDELRRKMIRRARNSAAGSQRS